jgi:two-component system NtrC family response regulator/two-component system response regulator AtoC
MTGGAQARSATGLLVVEDDDAYRTFLVGELNDLGFRVEGVRDASRALERVAEHEYDVVLMDIRLPGLDGMEALRRIRENAPGESPQVIMLTGHGSIDTAIEAMKLGAYDYLTKPCDINEMRVVIERAREHVELSRENTALRTILKRRDGGADIVGESPALRAALDKIARVAPTDATVLIVGESGTGKELAAQRLHRLSARSSEPFVDINCGAVQEALFESEFFGHERGSFTGAAAQKTGLVEAADGGSLFLDEVSEMPLATQVKLLRFLETGQFRRVGGVRALRAEVRVVAATNRDLDAWINDGRFRKDLFFRLAVYTIEIPPLRERGDDVRLLAEHFLRGFNGRMGRRVSGLDPEALAALRAYDWPGNVRELRNAMESAVILSDTGIVRLQDLPAHIAPRRRPPAAPAPAEEGEPEIATLAEVERRHIEAVLARMNGHRERTAKALGIAVKTLYRKLREYGVPESAERAK